MDRPCFVHERPWHINVPKSHFYEFILLDTHPHALSKLSAKYQFCAIRTTGNRDVYPWIVHVSSMFRPWFILALPIISDNYYRVGTHHVRFGSIDTLISVSCINIDGNILLFLLFGKICQKLQLGNFLLGSMQSSVFTECNNTTRNCTLKLNRF